jgi:hypothetical protein
MGHRLFAVLVRATATVADIDVHLSKPMRRLVREHRVSAGASADRSPAAGTRPTTRPPTRPTGGPATPAAAAPVHHTSPGVMYLALRLHRLTHPVADVILAQRDATLTALGVDPTNPFLLRMP